MFTLLLLGLIGQLVAQTPPSGTATAEAKVRPIAAPDIAGRSSELAALLRTTASHVQADPQVEAIRHEIGSVSSAVRDLTTYSRASMKAEGDIDGIESLLSQWNPVSTRLSRWTGTLRQRAGDLESDRLRLRDAEREWSATQQASEANELPDDVRKRVESMLLSIRQAQQQLAPRRGNVLALQAEVAEQVALTDAAIEEIRMVEARRRIGMLWFDNQPIWKAASAAAAPAPASPALKFSSESNSFAYEYGVTILVRVGVFLVLILVFWILLRRRVDRADPWSMHTDQDVRALAFLLHRPASAAVFLAVMASSIRWTNPPSWMITLAGLVLLVPSARLLPRMLNEELRKPFYTLLGLLVTVQLISLIPEGLLWSRFAWLLAQLMVTVSLWWMWRTRALWSPATGWGFWLRLLALLALVCAIVSSAANIAGVVRLGKFLAGTLLLTLYSAAIVRGMTVILAGFLKLALDLPRLNFLAPSPEQGAKLRSRIEQLSQFAGIIAFFFVTLYVATLLDPFRVIMDGFLREEHTFGAVRLSLYNLMVFAFVILCAVLISNGVRLAMEVGVYPRLGVQPGQKSAFTKILNYAILLTGIVIAFASAGVNLSNIAILAGGLSVGVGLGLQNVVNNFVSGVILLFERPLQVGEVIMVGPTVGFVKDIGIRASTIQTFEGADVIVPNGELISNQFTNWTHSPANRRMEINVSVAYGSDPKTVVSILMDVCQRHSEVVADPKPEVHFTGFGDSSLDFVLRAWCDKTRWIPVSTELRASIAEQFQTAGISMPFPQRDVYLHTTQVPPDAPPATVG